MTLTALDISRISRTLAEFRQRLSSEAGPSADPALIEAASRHELRAQIAQAVLFVAKDADVPPQFIEDLKTECLRAVDDRSEAVFKVYQQRPCTEDKLTVEKFTNACEFIAGHLNTLSEQFRNTAAYLGEQNAEKERQIAAMDNAQSSHKSNSGGGCNDEL